jgi:Major Facilitator Superfamily
LAVFLAIETRVKQPMLPLHFFRKPAFTGIQLAALAVSASMFALFLYLTFYLQGYLGHDPLEAGLRYLPFTIVTFFVSAATGALISRVQARYLLGAGLGITGVGLLLMGGLDPADEWTALLGGFLLGGAGVGLINPVIADVAVSVVPKEQSGMAAGINDTFRQVGIAVGIAAWGAIFLGRGSAKVEEVAAGTPAATGERPRQLVEAVSSGNLDEALAAVPPGARDQVESAANQGFLAGLNDIVMLGGILSIAGALFALWLVRERDIERGEETETERPHVQAEPAFEAA